MNLRRTTAVARKEFIHVLRDRRSLALALAIPVVLLVLFGYALTLDVENVKVVILDSCRTPESRELASLFSGTRCFRVVKAVDSHREISEALDRREAVLALVIPPDFGRDAITGRGARVQVIVDGSDPNTAGIALGYAQVMLTAHSRRVVLERMERSGAAGSAQGGLVLSPRIWFNPDLKSRNGIVPGLIAVIMMVIAALLTSLTVSREWERGTMEQLISTPVKGVELVVGKLAPYFVIGIADVAVAVAMGQFLFGVPLRGNAAFLFLASGVFLAGGLSMGMLVSIATRNQLLSYQLAMVLTFLPAFLLSGFVFPIENMPMVIQGASYLVPAKYFTVLVRAIYMKGLGPVELALETGLLALFAVAVFALATARFRKKLA